ncbi:hypothetical protein PsAD5_01064 [Pseudovibrio sp. Ad5]|uniref:hypothetical protein n=1 Tax=Pseudovibrio sp. Ad5 TaxID=989436 RepID=UPI0007AE94D8|nr:hypothetical protein [Pseudovibrio sp. Ad5]KZL00020.1 hypothetical protein PsAD5_01064 [Pseudovibrio sp. Ad5]
MSAQKRKALSDKIMEEYPYLEGVLHDSHTDLTSGSWDLVSYSFQSGFEKLWDVVKAEQSNFLILPLLSVWRQSIELTAKSSILQIEGKFKSKPGHNLLVLFKELKKAATDKGLYMDDEITKKVFVLFEDAQSVDPLADRFRYPTDNRGNRHVGIKLDLDELFQAHWMMITWCEGLVVELQKELGIDHL